MLKFWTREQCEQFQMMHFGVSCATCGRSDEECSWHRQDEVATALQAEEPISGCSDGFRLAEDSSTTSILFRTFDELLFKGRASVQ
jgi:hypothetical protein